MDTTEKNCMPAGKKTRKAIRNTKTTNPKGRARSPRPFGGAAGGGTLLFLLFLIAFLFFLLAVMHFFLVVLIRVPLLGVPLIFSGTLLSGTPVDPLHLRFVVGFSLTKLRKSLEGFLLLSFSVPGAPGGRPPPGAKGCSLRKKIDKAT